MSAITELSVTRLRNYEQAQWQGDARSVVLTGPNGAGKTNLLEAISLFAPGRGLRSAGLQELANRDRGVEAGWGVALVVSTEDGSRRLGTGVETVRDGTRRIARMDGRNIAKGAGGLAAFGRVLPMIWLTPAQDRLFLEGAAGRRRWLDRMVYGFDPGHAERLSIYEQALKQRAKLLKEARRTGRSADPAWLSALEAQMAEQGVALAAARLDAVDRLDQAMADAIEGPEDPFPSARAVLEGSLEAELRRGEKALAVEEEFAEVLRKARPIDAKAGGATNGPHRTDLSVFHRRRDIPASVCSTGEQKALLMGLTLAYAALIAADRGTPPILLLDEVAAHLDPVRRRALFSRIGALGAQAWMTGTEVDFFDDLVEKAQFLTVDDATLIRDSGG